MTIRQLIPAAAGGLVGALAGLYCAAGLTRHLTMREDPMGLIGTWACLLSIGSFLGGMLGVMIAQSLRGRMAEKRQSDNSFVYDVAISFAEQDGAAASVAAELDTRLSGCGLSVFYFHSVDDAAATLGERLTETLRSVYADRSRVVVAVGSEHYGATHYTALEVRGGGVQAPRRGRPRTANSPIGRRPPRAGAARRHAFAGPRDGRRPPLPAVRPFAGVQGPSPSRHGPHRVEHGIPGRGPGDEGRARVGRGGGRHPGRSRRRSGLVTGLPRGPRSLDGGPASCRADALSVLTEGPRLLLYRRAGGVGVWAFLAIWCVTAAIFFIDLGLDRAIAGDVREHRIDQARDRWIRWNPSLFYHRAASQLAINEAIASTVRESASFEQVLARMASWWRDPVRLDRTFEAARKELSGWGEPILTRTTYAPPGEAVAPWWSAAWEINLWPSSSDQWSRLVGRLGARQLLLSLADGGSDPFTWTEGWLRDFEAEALETYAKEVVGRYGVRNWGGPRHRLALLAPTRDWHELEMGAAAEARADDPPGEPPEALAFVNHAPAELVRPWIAANLSQSTKGYMLNAIAKAIETRGDPESMFCLLDLADSGACPTTLSAGSGTPSLG